jgi:hypothetical protein
VLCKGTKYNFKTKRSEPIFLDPLCDFDIQNDVLVSIGLHKNIQIDFLDSPTMKIKILLDKLKGFPEESYSSGLKRKCRTSAVCLDPNLEYISVALYH